MSLAYLLTLVSMVGQLKLATAGSSRISPMTRLWVALERSHRGGFTWGIMQISLATQSAAPGAKGTMSSEKLARMRAAVRTLLIGVGEDPDREGLIDTPKARHVQRAT